MKLITLNIWGGKTNEALLHFVKEKANQADIFCFQEVYNGPEGAKAGNDIISNIHSLLCDALPNHRDFYAETYKVENQGVKIPYGLAIFVRKDLEIRAQGSYEIFKMTDDLGLPEGIEIWNRLLQYFTIPYKKSEITIFNLHGLYTGGGKGDDEARLEQSRKVRAFMQNHHGEKVLCGDFNLNPETKSMKILEEGMRNLIKENNIHSTRSHYYTSEGKFADYILVSPGVHVTRFEVLQDAVSDHLPLCLRF